MSQTRTANQWGYTLLELLVALGVIVLMVSVLPNLFTGFLPGVEMREKADDITIALAGLRNQAVETQGTVAFEVENFAKNGFEITLKPHPDFEGVSQDAIEFYANGRNSGGILEISKDKRVETLTIDWLTGRIERGNG